MVFVHAWVRLRDITEWHDTRLAEAFTFGNGQATWEMRRIRRTAARPCISWTPRLRRGVTVDHGTPEEPPTEPLTWTVPGETMIMRLHGRNLPRSPSV
jgi:hypothetical protein